MHKLLYEFEIRPYPTIKSLGYVHFIAHNDVFNHCEQPEIFYLIFYEACAYWPKISGELQNWYGCIINAGFVPLIYII